MKLVCYVFVALLLPNIYFAQLFLGDGAAWRCAGVCARAVRIFFFLSVSLSFSLPRSLSLSLSVVFIVMYISQNANEAHFSLFNFSSLHTAAAGWTAVDTALFTPLIYTFLFTYFVYADACRT